MPRYKSLFTKTDAKKFAKLDIKTQSNRLFGASIFIIVFSVLLLIIIATNIDGSFMGVLFFPIMWLIIGFLFLIGAITRYLKAKEIEEETKIFNDKLLSSNIETIDKLSGKDFELFCKLLYEKLGYTVSTTKASRDYGVDLILYRNNVKSIGQCKRYNDKVSLSAVQEIVGAKRYYDCYNAFIITNNYFTKSAISLAEANSVELIDRKKLVELIYSVQKNNKINIVKDLSVSSLKTTTQNSKQTTQKIISKNTSHNNFTSFAHAQKDKIVNAYLNQDYANVKTLIEEVETSAGDLHDNKVTLHFFYQDVSSILYAFREINKDAINDCLSLCNKDIALLSEIKFNSPVSITTLTRKAIILEKKNEILSAIKVCDFGIKNNFLDNGKPFIIRKARLEKKLNIQN
jgi:restriction system protein